MRTALALVALASLGAAAPIRAQDPNIRITVQFIQADGFTDDDPAIVDVVSELRELFRFDGYRLLTEATMTAGLSPDGDPTILNQRVVPSADDRFGLEVFLRPTDQPDAYRVALHLSDARMEWRGESGIRAGPAILAVSFNARDGQTVVIGSSRYDPEKPTLIVAFRADRMD